MTVALACALLFAAPAAEGAARHPDAPWPPPLKAIWGVLKTQDGRSAFPHYERLGVDVLQIQLHWDRVAPSRPKDQRNPRDPAYVWPTALDGALAAARRHGLEIALMATRSPAWANGGHGSAWAPAPAAFARFLTAASRRYPAVRRWMIWGEPNRDVLFQPQPHDSPVAPRAYARLLDAAYGALKRRSPRNVVIGGMTVSFGSVHPAAWLRWMRLPNGRRPRLDEYGHNPFSLSRRRPALGRGRYAHLPDSRDIDLLDVSAAEVRRAYRDDPRHRGSGGPPLWVSEFTVSSGRPDRAFGYAVSRVEQARWLRAAHAIARRVGASGFGWFNLQDEPSTVPGGLTMGLLSSRGARKPAYREFARLP